MNRDIKFRGKRLDNGEWVYGDLLHIGGGCLIYFGSQTEVETLYIENGSPIAVELFKTEIAVVDPNTVEQFTGMHDKNGKEIYEGDILGGSQDKYKFVIRYNDYLAAFVFTSVDLNNKWHRLAADYNIKQFEVVGNIHDELLKGGEE